MTKSIDRQIALIRFLSAIEDCSICAWLYPESNVDSIAGLSVQQSALEPVTSYDNGVNPRHTMLE